MAYSFKQIEAHDPNNPGLVAPNASVTIFEPGDPAKTPLTITTLTGEPLANPVTVNGLGYGPAFMHATLPQVAWSGGGLTGTFESYEGMRDEAIAARDAANTAAANAAAEAQAAIGDATAAAEAAADAADASALAAANSAALVGAPADNAIATAINATGSATKTALSATYVPQTELDITQVGVGWNLKAGAPENAIGADVLGSVIVGDGYPGRENVVGNGIIANVGTATSNVPANLADLLNADANTRANHCFVAGYDNVAAGLKAVILADHSYVRNGASHNTIGGGATHKVDAGHYSTISGGYLHTIIAGDNQCIAGGRNNLVNTPGGGNVTVAGKDNTVTGSGGSTFGVSNNVSGTGGFAAGASNIVNGGYGHAIGTGNTAGASAVAAGTNNTASGASSRATGNANTASGAYASAHGNQNSAVGTGAVAEGVLNTATPNYSSARGSQAVATVSGQHAVANGAFAVAGDAQTSVLIQKATTTTATEGFFANSYVVPANQSVGYTIHVTARDTTTGDTKTWRIDGAAKRVGTANPVAVGGSFPAATQVVADAATAAWTCRVSGSGTSIVILMTGEAAKTIRWVARTELVEVG